MNNCLEMGEWPLGLLDFTKNKQLFYSMCNDFECRWKSTVRKIEACFLEDFYHIRS